MKKILFLSLLVPFFSFAEIWVDYEPAEQVTEMTVVKVKANIADFSSLKKLRDSGRADNAKVNSKIPTIPPA